MSASLQKFRELTRVFDPIYRPSGADDGGSVSGFYVADAHEEFRRQLEAALLVNDHAKLLVAGQLGCGKTTLLHELVRGLRAQGRLAVFVDLEVEAAVQDLGLVEVHLAAAMETLRAADREALTVSAEHLNSCAAWVERAGGPQREATAAALADAMQQILVAARDNPDVRRTLREMVRPGEDSDPHHLLERLLESLADRRPVVVLDGLDKVAPDRAREFFLGDKRKPMADAPGTAILTIPLSLVYEPSFNVLGERYNNADSAVLPAIRLYEFDAGRRLRTRSERGFSLLRRVVEMRAEPVAPGALMDDAVERLIEGSGGNIRELARLTQAAVVKAVVRRGEFVERQDVEAAIADRRESFRRAYDPRFLKVLKTVREEFRLDNEDDVAKVLLYGLWVMEYRNGISWYCLPVPVEQLLDQLARR